MKIYKKNKQFTNTNCKYFIAKINKNFCNVKQILLLNVSLMFINYVFET